MPTFHELFERIRRLLRSSQVDDELAEEIRLHLEARIEALRHMGLTESEAASRARREFGSPLHMRERARDAWRFAAVDDFLADVRFGGRMLRKQPTVSAVIALMLVLGIGVNTTVFSWLETIVLHPLPGVSDQSTLVVVVQSDAAHTLLPLMSYPDFEDLSSSPTLSGVIGTRSTTALLEHDGRSSWVSAIVATANMFDVLGISPEYGRTFVRNDDIGEGQHPVVVLADAYWRREFGADPTLVGRAVRINQRAFTVIGIAPPWFHGVTGGARVDLWAPLAMHATVLNFGSYTSRSFRWIYPLARLARGTRGAQAEAALAVLSAQMASAHPDSNKGITFRVFSLWESPYGGQAAFLPVLQIVFAMTGGLLLIVLANVSCLLLSSAAHRRTEMTIRIAMGAGRFRLARQFATESLILAALGGLGGTVFASSAVRAMPRLIPIGASSFAYDFALSKQALGFTTALTLLTAVLVSLLPALAAGDIEVMSALRRGIRGSTRSVHHQRVLGAVVVSEVAIALALLVGAGLCVRGFRQAARIDVGFDPDRVVYAGLNLVPNGYTAERARVFDHALRERVRSIPGVIGVAFVNTPPLGAMHTFTGAVEVDSRESRANENPMIPFVIASPGYLSVMRIRLVAGRDFDDADDDARPHVALVNQAMVRRYWPGLNPIGRRFRMAIGITPPETLIVIGVCGTSKYESLAEPSTPMVYVTYLQRPIASLFMNLVVRAQTTPDTSLLEVRQALHALDPSVEPLDPMSMRQYIEPAFMPVRIAAILLVIVGGTALLLAAIGLYAVMSYVASQRAREVAVRVALGAAPLEALRPIVGHGMTLVAAGLVAGQMVTFVTSRLLTRFLYGINSTDAATVLAITGLLAVVALTACVIPAWRIMRTDPVAVMRAD